MKRFMYKAVINSLITQRVFTLASKNSGMEISPEKSERMSFLGQAPVIRNSLWITNVYNKYRILNVSVVKFPMKMARIFNQHQQNFLKYWKF